MNQPDSSVDEGESSSEDKMTYLQMWLLHYPKICNTAKEENPFEESSESWDSSVNLFSKSIEARKENKREKGRKSASLERVWLEKRQTIW